MEVELANTRIANTHFKYSGFFYAQNRPTGVGFLLPRRKDARTLSGPKSLLTPVGFFMSKERAL